SGPGDPGRSDRWRTDEGRAVNHPADRGRTRCKSGSDTGATPIPARVNFVECMRATCGIIARGLATSAGPECASLPAIRKRAPAMSVVKLRIGPANHGRPMTLDEFLEAEEEPGYHYELARGVLEVSEVPDDDHGKVVDNLREAISLYRRDHRDRII